MRTSYLYLIRPLPIYKLTFKHFFSPLVIHAADPIRHSWCRHRILILSAPILSSLSTIKRDLAGCSFSGQIQKVGKLLFTGWKRVVSGGNLALRKRSVGLRLISGLWWQLTTLVVVPEKATLGQEWTILEVGYVGRSLAAQLLGRWRGTWYSGSQDAHNSKMLEQFFARATGKLVCVLCVGGQPMP